MPEGGTTEDASSGGPPLLGVAVWGPNPMGGGLKSESPGGTTHASNTQTTLETTSVLGPNPKVSISALQVSKMTILVFPSQNSHFQSQKQLVL